MSTDDTAGQAGLTVSAGPVGLLPRAIAAVTAWMTDPQAVAAECADMIASAGDLLWPGPRARAAPVPPGLVTSAVASGLLLLAGCPGGATFGAQHWCTAPHYGCPGISLAPDDTGGEKGTGAVHTPPWLADAVTAPALDALIYRPGPLQTARRATWRLIPAAEIAALRIADISCGSGAFLLSAGRYLGRALNDAWQAEGDPRGGDITAATRLVVASCLAGADINPAAVALSKLALQLLAYQPRTSAARVEQAFTAGDSLLGIDWRTAFPVVMRRGGFDAVIGNPPFLGGHKITGELGIAYRARLVTEIARGHKGSADLAAYFLLRGWDLLNGRGQLAVLATNTLAQGATRRVGLEQLRAEGGDITWAIKSAPWPDARANLEYCAAVISRAPVARDARRVIAEVRGAPSGPAASGGAVEGAAA